MENNPSSCFSELREEPPETTGVSDHQAKQFANVQQPDRSVRATATLGRRATARKTGAHTLKQSGATLLLRPEIHCNVL